MHKLNISRINLLLFLYLSCFSGIHAQLNINSIGIDLGIIHNVDPNSDFIGNSPLLFPEVYLSGDILESYLNWRFNLGYWDDGRSKPTYSDMPNISYTSFVINAEMVYILPDSNPDHLSPLRLLTGLSYQYVSAKDIERYESDTIPMNNFNDNLFYFNTGLELHLFIKRHLSLFTKGLVYLQLNKNEKHNYKSPRFQLSLGLNYRFKN